MSKSQMVKEAMKYNRAAIIGRRIGGVPASVAAFIDARTALMRMAREA